MNLPPIERKNSKTSHEFRVGSDVYEVVQTKTRTFERICACSVKIFKNGLEVKDIENPDTAPITVQYSYSLVRQVIEREKRNAH